MSSIVNKIKDAIHSDKSSQPEGTSGPHSSRAANAADPRVDSDRDHRGANAYGSSTTTSAHDGSYTTSDNYTHGSSTYTSGPHNSNIANKADPRVDSDRDGSHLAGTNTYGSSTTGTGLTGSHGTTGTTGTGIGSTGHSTNAGPHNSNVANKLDPRVDSDRDGNRIAGNNTSNYSSTTGTSGLTGTHGTTGTSGLTGTHGTHGTTGTGYGTSSHSTNAGPHSSNVANKLDPRVDSDRDGNRIAGNNTSNYSSTTGTTGSGLTGTHGTHGTHGTTHSTTGAGYGTSGHSTNAGPHSSNVANKLDPRVDSDRDGNRIAGNNTSNYSSTTGTTGSGLTGTHGTHGTSGYSTNAGPHSSNIANKADPRVDSDRDGSHLGGNTYGTTGTHGSSGLTGTHGSSGLTGTHGTHGTTGLSSNPGPAPNTAGPHKSDALNKIDPRVDSDRDGSKTLGADKTYSRPDGTTSHYKDPTDAAQVPPSVLQKHIGPPTVAHDSDSHDHSRRHSVSHQEQHRGL